MDMLVIIDMVNGFINEGALADKNINNITPNIINLINKAQAKNMPIVAFKDCHDEFDDEFKIFPPHCIKGTSESELIDELKPYEDDFIVIEKNTTNGFITQKFLNIVKNHKIDNVYVTGCCTDICVNGFVNSYLKFIEKYSLSTKIKVIGDACATFDGQNHSALLEHNKSLKEMEKNGAKIIFLAKEYIKE